MKKTYGNNIDYSEWERSYVCIDLKSVYASVECVERGLDPMTTDLVVADPTRTDRTICLAVSPSLKARGVSGRARVFEIPKSFEYIMAPPRMSLYLDYAAAIYKVYLDWIAPGDMHVYSIDEVFIDATSYLNTYKMETYFNDLRSARYKKMLVETLQPASKLEMTSQSLSASSGEPQVLSLPPAVVDEEDFVVRKAM